MHGGSVKMLKALKSTDVCRVVKTESREEEELGEKMGKGW